MAFDTLLGTDGFDVSFIGTDGVDVLDSFNDQKAYVGGRMSDDTVFINQPLTGVAGGWNVQMGMGNDFIDFLDNDTQITDSTLNGNVGNDEIDVDGPAAQSLINGGQDSDDIDVDGLLNTVVRGSKGDDFIEVDDSDDIVVANSTVNGNEDNDQIELDGSSGLTVDNSLIAGGQGTDSIEANDVDFNNTIINGNKGEDNIQVIDGSAIGLSIFGGGAADTLFVDNVDDPSTGDPAGIYLSGDNGSDLIEAQNSEGDDTLMGGEGNDTARAGEGNDLLDGGVGHDSLLGGQGDDTLMGGEGDDTMRSGAGEDFVTGGLGADVYDQPNIGAGVTTYLIDDVAESAAEVTGTERTFDAFTTLASFAFPDELDISAVSSFLAGGAVNNVFSTNIGFQGGFDNFADLKTALDLGGWDASTTGGIELYSFSATIDGNFGFYAWFQDSQSQFSSNDLLFQTAFAGQITAGQVVV